MIQYTTRDGGKHWLKHTLRRGQRQVDISVNTVSGRSFAFSYEGKMGGPFADDIQFFLPTWMQEEAYIAAAAKYLEPREDEDE